jgi:hypothetical protein
MNWLIVISESFGKTKNKNQCKDCLFQIIIAKKKMQAIAAQSFASPRRFSW